MAFVDEVKISVKAGKGGNGCNSFFRHKRMRHPKPDGGDGAKGGDVVIITDTNVNTLLDFRFNHHFSAKDGSAGSGNNKKGRSGQDYIIKVPVGTVIKDADTGFILRDLNQPKESLIVAKGGQSGKGNASFKKATEGEPGEQKNLLLELKLIADVGVVGFPNVGKSTLISNISNAKTKIADYPFTTKAPILGMVRQDDFSFVIADLPGLIEGAHRGKGLGDRFLRHIERTKLILHLLDMAGVEGRDPVKDYHKLNEELKLYSRDLANKPQIIVANKMDLTPAKNNLKRFKVEVKKDIYPISALKEQGLNSLIKVLMDELCKEPIK